MTSIVHSMEAFFFIDLGRRLAIFDELTCFPATFVPSALPLTALPEGIVP